MPDIFVEYQAFNKNITNLNDSIVPRTRIELARPKSVTRPSTWRVYQFRHLGFPFPTVPRTGIEPALSEEN